MEKLIATFSGLTAWKKVLLLVLSPLALAFLFLGGGGALTSFLDGRTRSKVDAKSDELDQKAQANDRDQANEEGRLAQLEEDKAKAVASANDDDAIAFHNSRKKD